MKHLNNILTLYCDNKRHLVCHPYSVVTLHLMAKQLDIKRCWYHGGKYPHYDIPKKRIKEIQQQCEVLSTKEIFNFIKYWKNIPVLPNVFEFSGFNPFTPTVAFQQD